MQESEMPPVKAGNLEANGGNTACGVEIIYSTSTVTQIFHQELLVAFGADLYKCRSAPSRTQHASINEKLNIVNIIGMCLQGHHWLQINIDLDTGLALYWWQANVWTNADIAHSA